MAQVLPLNETPKRKRLRKKSIFFRKRTLNLNSVNQAIDSTSVINSAGDIRHKGRAFSVQEIFFGDKLEKDKFVIIPDDKRKITWDLFIAALVVYACVWYPVRASFSINVFSLFVLDIIADVVFVLDIVFTMFTSYQKDGIYVSKRSKIRARYLRSWFFVDILSVLPIDAIPSLPRAVGRFVSLARLLRLNKIFNLYNRATSVSHQTRMFATTCGFVLLVHWLACLWHAVSWSVFVSGQFTWIHNLPNNSRQSRYISSFYWSMMTMTTVGYGDIEVSSPAERLVQIVAMFLGSFLYAVMFGNINLIIYEMNGLTESHREEKNVVDMFSHNLHLGKTLHNRLQRYIDVKWMATDNDSLQNILAQPLPQSLKHDLVAHTVGALFTKSPPFCDVTSSVLTHMCECFRFVVCSPQEVMVREQDAANQVFFIVTGRIQIERNETGPLCELTSGGFFGVQTVLLDLVRSPFTARALTFAQLYSINSKKFVEIIGTFPNLDKLLTVMAQARRSQRSYYNDSLMLREIYEHAISREEFLTTSMIRQTNAKAKTENTEKRATQILSNVLDKMQSETPSPNRKIRAVTKFQKLAKKTLDLKKSDEKASLQMKIKRRQIRRASMQQAIDEMTEERLHPKQTGKADPSNGQKPKFSASFPMMSPPRKNTKRTLSLSVKRVRTWPAPPLPPSRSH